MKSVKHFMVDQGWDQADLAAELDVHYSYVSLLLAGKRVPSVGLLQKMAKVTGVPVEKLINEAGKPAKRKQS